MGIFGGTSKPSGSTEPLVREEEERPVPPKPQNSSTIIAKGMTIKGTLRGEGMVQVEGTVEGEISLKGSASIMSSGVMKGPVTADAIRVAGRMEGPLDAREHLHLSASGDIEGDVKTPSLIVDDGGRLNGRTTVVRKKKPQTDPDHPFPELQFGSKYRDEE